MIFFFKAITDNVSVYSRIVSFDEADNYLNTEHEFRFEVIKHLIAKFSDLYFLTFHQL